MYLFLPTWIFIKLSKSEFERELTKTTDQSRLSYGQTSTRRPTRRRAGTNVMSLLSNRATWTGSDPAPCRAQLSLPAIRRRGPRYRFVELTVHYLLVRNTFSPWPSVIWRLTRVSRTSTPTSPTAVISRGEPTSSAFSARLERLRSTCSACRHLGSISDSYSVYASRCTPAEVLLRGETLVPSRSSVQLPHLQPSVLPR